MLRNMSVWKQRVLVTSEWCFKSGKTCYSTILNAHVARNCNYFEKINRDFICFRIGKFSMMEKPSIHFIFYPDFNIFTEMFDLGIYCMRRDLTCAYLIRFEKICRFFFYTLIGEGDPVICDLIFIILSFKKFLIRFANN